MKLAEKPVRIGDFTFLVRYSTRELLRAEAELGRPIMDVLQKGKALSLADTCILVRHGLHNPDMSAVSAETFQKFLDETAPLEFIRIAGEIITDSFAAPATPETNPGKN